MIEAIGCLIALAVILADGIYILNFIATKIIDAWFNKEND